MHVHKGVGSKYSHQVSNEGGIFFLQRQARGGGESLPCEDGELIL